MPGLELDRRERSRLLLLNAGAFLLVATAMLVVWVLLGRQRAEEDWVRHTDAVLLRLDALLADIVDSETAERGFVITGQPSFLQPYEAARQRFRDDLDALHVLTRDNPEQQKRLTAATRVARAELAAFERVIALRRSDPEAATAAIAGGGDKQMTDEVRRWLAELKGEELRLLARRERAASWTNRMTALIVVGVHGLLLAALAWAAWKTQQSLVQRQLAEREAARLATRAELERERRERDDFREQFLAVVGHDLRSPLSAISIEAQLLRRTCDATSASAAGERILGSTERMVRMVSQLLDVTRSRLGGGMPISKRHADLRALLGTVVQEVARASPERVVLRADTPALGAFDTDRMAQVFANLIGNALQHGEGDVSVSLQAIEQAATLTVHNGGDAIPEEECAHLFDAFHHGRGQPAGLGLGLYITREIVRGHNGSIEVQSSLAGGTTFVVTLPL